MIASLVKREEYVATGVVLIVSFLCYTLIVDFNKIRHPVLGPRQRLFRL
jgi:hypothetical protein